MSLLNSGLSASEGDEVGDSEQQLRVFRGSPASIDPRKAPAQVRSQPVVQAQLHSHLLAQLQAQLPCNLVNNGSITLNPVQYITGFASGYQGDIAMSATRLVRSTLHLSTCGVPPTTVHELTVGISIVPNGFSGQKQHYPVTNGGMPVSEEIGVPESSTPRPFAEEEAPSCYIGQPPAWFLPGRCFSIWAPSDASIHKGRFILLDSFNSEGRGVPVTVLGNEELKQIADSSTSYQNRVLLKGYSRASISRPHSSASTRPSSSQEAPGYPRQETKAQDPDSLRAVEEKLLQVTMDDQSPMDVHPGTVINLFVVYNIPFLKYKCVDHGMLDDESFENLRFHYIMNLVKVWRLTRRAREAFKDS